MIMLSDLINLDTYDINFVNSTMFKILLKTIYDITIILFKIKIN
jgi:hypothetical protein